MKSKMSVLRNIGISKTIATVCGLVVAIAFFVVSREIRSVSTELTTWVAIILYFAFIVGVVDLVAFNVHRVRSRAKKEWLYSAWLIFVLFAVLIVGLTQGITSATYQQVYGAVLVPLQATTFALLGFYITSAAYRAMRARNIEAFLLLVSAVLVMLMNMPIGGVIWDGFPIIGNFLYEKVSGATNRAIMMGMATATLILALRILLGRETRYLGRG